jgi:iron(III) transport system substrate-binding protein
MIKASLKIVVAVLPALLFVSRGNALAGSAPEEAAKAEGKVVFYSSINTPQLKALADAFAKRYPQIKLSLYRASGDRVIQRIVTEGYAGNFEADVFSASGFKIQVAKEKGLTAKFVSDQSAFYVDGFKDPDGQWTNLHSLPNTMAYNTKLVPAREAPKNYQDLLQLKWKGKIGVNPRDPEWYVNLQRRMGKETAKEFLKKLATRNPGLHESHSLLAQLLAAGEYDVAANSYTIRIALDKEKGAPTQWVFDEPVITYLHPIALAKNAPHPNAGKLFINFVLSREGQTVLKEQGLIPGHRDVDATAFQLKGVRLFPSNPRWATDYERASKEIREILEGN